MLDKKNVDWLESTLGREIIVTEVGMGVFDAEIPGLFVLYSAWYGRGGTYDFLEKPIGHGDSVSDAVIALLSRISLQPVELDDIKMTLPAIIMDESQNVQRE